MKRVLITLLLLVALPAMAQRGGSTQQPVNLMPTCSATSGACPANNYFCVNGDEVLYRCSVNQGWQVITLPQHASLPSSCDKGCIQYTGAASGQQIYCCESNVYVQQGGSGGGSSTLAALTDTSITSVAGGDMLLYDGSNSWDNKVMSGDATITSGGALTIASNSVALGTDTTGNYVDDITTSQGLARSGNEGATLGLIACASGEVLKRNAGNDGWECASDSTGSGGSAIVLDLGDDGGNDSTDLNEIATSDAAVTIFTMPVADKLLIDTGVDWPNAATATALAANGANCSASNIPLGVDASGAVEGCYQPASTDLSDTANVVLNNASNTWSTGLQTITGDTDEIQLLVTGNSTQNSDIFVVEKSDGTDMLTVSDTEVVIGDSTDGNRGLELIDNTSTCPDPAASNTSLCAVGGEIYMRDTGGTAQPLVRGTDDATYGPAMWAEATVSCTTACTNIDLTCDDAWELTTAPAAVGCSDTTNPRVCFCK